MAVNSLTIVMLIGIYLVMAGFSCTIDLKTFYSYIKKPKAICIGLLTQYGLLPLTSYFITRLLSLEPLLSIAFIILSSCPGGTLSNFWCWFFGSDLPLSIAMTTASSILSFAFLTINCLIYMPFITNHNHGKVTIDYGSLGLSVSSLIFGVCTGLYISYKKDKYRKLKKVLIVLGGISVIVTLLLGAYQNTLVSSSPVYELPFKIFVAAIMLNLMSWFITLSVSHFVFHLSHNQSITVGIECSNQNMGLAIAIILLTMDMKTADIAIGVPMFYGVLNSFIIFIFGTLFRIFGFISEEDENENYKNSGFTKLVNLCNKHVHHHTTHTHIQTNSNLTTSTTTNRTEMSEVNSFSKDYEAGARLKEKIKTETAMTTTTGTTQQQIKSLKICTSSIMDPDDDAILPSTIKQTNETTIHTPLTELEDENNELVTIIAASE